jgi:hypothetical protein
MFGKELEKQMTLPTCKEVSTIIAHAEFDEAPVLVRLRMWAHLAICWHCRRFKSQMRLIRRALRKSVFPVLEKSRIECLEQKILSRYL